jgi:hypothetical protein
MALNARRLVMSRFRSAREESTTFRRFAGVKIAAILVMCVGSVSATLHADNDPEGRARRSEFQATLNQSFTPSWDHIGLRDIVRSLEEVVRISVILDRRLDPTVERTLKISSNSLRECFDRLAEQCDAGTCILGSAVYLGPRSTARKMRTLITLRKQELAGLGLPDSRHSALNQGKPIQWDDFEEPAELLRRISAEWKLEIDNPELIPHDRWAGDAVPDANAVEALTLVLAQFDLTFRWGKEALSIHLEPIPESVTIEKSYTPPTGRTLDAAAQQWTQAIPGLAARGVAGKLVVRGTVEQLELADRLQRGETLTPAATTKPAGTTQLPPLANKRYNGKIENIPVRDLMRNLETPAQGQITFVFAEETFRAAGIDLDRRVTFELRNANVDQILHKMFDPLGVAFELKGRTASLRPAKGE